MAGFEPTTTHPPEVRYQAALHPEVYNLFTKDRIYISVKKNYIFTNNYIMIHIIGIVR